MEHLSPTRVAGSLASISDASEPARTAVLSGGRAAHAGRHDDVTRRIPVPSNAVNSNAAASRCGYPAGNLVEQTLRSRSRPGPLSLGYRERGVPFRHRWRGDLGRICRSLQFIIEGGPSLDPEHLIFAAAPHTLYLKDRYRRNRDQSEALCCEATIRAVVAAFRRSADSMSLSAEAQSPLRPHSFWAWPTASRASAVSESASRRSSV